MYPILRDHISALDSKEVPKTRKRLLHPLIAYIRSGLQDDAPIRLQFICTHNSRRSHLAQVWMQTLAGYHGLDEMHCFSGGTEATAVYPMVVKTLEEAGFHPKKLSQDENPIYEIYYSDNTDPIVAFSKRYDDINNPSSHFAAVMTCEKADQDCPFIPGANQRISIPYDDPKAYDSTPDQTTKYRERSFQIATEMNFVLLECLVS